MKHLKEKAATLTPFTAAIAGLVSIIPFLVANILVMYQVEPLISILRPQGVTSTFEVFFLFCLAIFFPLIGAYIALQPMISKRKTKRQKKHIYMFNTCVAIFLILGVILLTRELSQEIYACDIMSIVNCVE